MTQRLLRILVVNKHPSDVLGGSEMQTDIIAAGLQRRGHDVTYAAIGGRRGSYDTSYRVEPIDRPFRSQFRALLAYRGSDVIYWRHNRYDLLTAVLLARSAGVPFVFGVSSLGDVRPGSGAARSGSDRRVRPGTLFRLLLNRRAIAAPVNHVALRLVDGATSLNRDYLDLLPVAHRIYLPNAVPEAVVPSSWPRPFVLWAANVKASKDPEAFVALARDCRDLPVDFLMVGRLVDSGYRDLLERAAATPNFHYLGPKTPDEVNGMLRASLFLVHTCHPEGFGNIFIQAWKAGRPTVSLHFDPEGLIEGEGVGYLAGDLPSLSRRVRELVTDDGAREAMCGRAAALGARYSADRTVDRIEAFLLETVRRRSGAASYGHPSA
jgi:glycosyltransferase involved in cell wall biosynthesis